MEFSHFLYKLLSLWLLSSSFLWATPPAPAPQPPIFYQQLSRELLKKMIEIRSVHDAGTREVVDVLANEFKAAGFPSEDIHVISQKDHPEQVNLVVRLRGQGKDKPVLWLGHLDVVEAKSEDWSLPPFSFTEKEHYFYGRGITDMKDEDAAMASALIRLKKEDYIPQRDIILAFTTDEEVSQYDGIDYLLRLHRPLVDAGLVINPDGGSGELAQGKRLSFGIETSQKVYASYLLEVTNKGGHSSEPRKDNPIYALATALERLSQYQFPFVINDTTRLYFQRMAANEQGQTRADMLAVAQSKPDLAAAARLAQKVSFNALLHTTCVPTLLSGGHQENALPQRATATIQCRIMPNETPEDTRRALEKAVANPEIHIKLISEVMRAPESPPTPELLSSVEKVVQGMWPGVTVIPTMIAGASDSIYTRYAGIPTYGIGGSWKDVDDLRVHGKDERHEVNDFYSSVEFTYRLMKELSHSGSQ